MESTRKQQTFNNLINAEPLVLVNFFTEWCGPCNMMKSILEDLKLFLGGRALVLKVDIEKNIKVAARYQIMDIPTFILFKRGKIVWKHSGPVAPSRVREIIEQNA